MIPQHGSKPQFGRTPLLDQLLTILSGDSVDLITSHLRNPFLRFKLLLQHCHSALCLR
jgi:hypothetical protein